MIVDEILGWDSVCHIAERDREGADLRVVAIACCLGIAEAYFGIWSWGELLAFEVRQLSHELHCKRISLCFIGFANLDHVPADRCDLDLGVLAEAFAIISHVCKIELHPCDTN